MLVQGNGGICDIRFTGAFPISVKPVGIGESKVEGRMGNGLFPSSRVQLSYLDILAMVFAGGQSRLYGGIHFEEAVTAGELLCLGIDNYTLTASTQLFGGKVKSKSSLMPTTTNSSSTPTMSPTTTPSTTTLTKTLTTTTTDATAATAGTAATAATTATAATYCCDCCHCYHCYHCCDYYHCYHCYHCCDCCHCRHYKTNSHPPQYLR